MHHRRGVHLRDARLDHAQRQADLAHGHLLVVVERHHQPLAVGQVGDGVGQALFEFARADSETADLLRAGREHRPVPLRPSSRCAPCAACRSPGPSDRPAAAGTRRDSIPISAAISASPGARPSRAVNTRMASSTARPLRRSSRGLQSSVRRLSRIAPRMRNCA